MGLLAQLGLDWIGAQVIAGVVGTIVGLFIREMLPESTKATIAFWGGRAQKWLKNRTYRIKLSAEYEFDDPVDYEELIEDLARDVRQRPTDIGQFSYMESSGSSSIEVEIDPQYAGSVSQMGAIEIDEDRVEAVIASFECSPRYRDLVPTLLDLQSIERSVNEALTAQGARSGDTIVHCEMPAKPLLQKLLGTGDIETLKAESEDGTRIDVTREEIQLHSPPSKSLLPTIRKTIVFFT